ncbi:helix-turn-helix domain-containing protein [Holdemania filiformis]|uniref:helix-turn-helix domain-containing protein n=1 Tax=Holdemania filiformis TaxID=61171 RepID=UPI002674CE0F|nr:helix-turn-helix transcriptional regulator [Holdemania filiformis]
MINTDESKLKAALIRKRRIELNWKQEAFAKSLPMANSSFSEMERGLRPITEELYKTITTKLELPSLTNEWLEEQKIIMDLIKEKLYFYEYEEASRLIKKLQKQNDFLNNSLLFLEYNLTLFIYNVTFNNSMELRKIKVLKTYQDCLDSIQNYQFILYQGIAEKNKLKLDQAMKCFQVLLELPYTVKYYTDLLYYHVAICFIQIGHLTLAHNFNKKADALFKEEGNFQRIAYTMMHEAIIYSQENHPEEAGKIYKKLLKTYSKHLSDHTVNTILCNAGNNYVNATQYDKAQNIYKQLKPGWQNIPEIFYGIAWTLLQTDQHDKLDEFLKYSKQYPKNKFIKDMLEIINLQRKSNNEKEIETKLKACEKYLNREGSSEGMIFIYEQLIQYYETRSIVKQVKYLKKLNELNKRGMQYEQ